MCGEWLSRADDLAETAQRVCRARHPRGLTRGSSLSPEACSYPRHWCRSGTSCGRSSWALTRASFWPRLAVGWRPASGDYEGGFTLHLDSWRDAAGVEREHIYSPWVSMLHLNPPADLKRFTRPKDPDPAEPDPASPSAAICSTSRAWLHARRASPIPQAIPRERLLARPLEGRTAAHATARAA